MESAEKDGDVKRLFGSAGPAGKLNVDETAKGATTHHNGR